MLLATGAVNSGSMPMQHNGYGLAEAATGPLLAQYRLGSDGVSATGQKCPSSGLGGKHRGTQCYKRQSIQQWHLHLAWQGHRSGGTSSPWTCHVGSVACRIGCPSIVHIFRLFILGFPHFGVRGFIILILIILIILIILFILIIIAILQWITITASWQWNWPLTWGRRIVLILTLVGVLSFV